MTGKRQGRVEMTPGVCDGEPHVAGTRVRVQDVVLWHVRHGLSYEQLRAQYPQLSREGVAAALAWYREHSEVINAALDEAERETARLRARAAARLIARSRTPDLDA